MYTRWETFNSVKSLDIISGIGYFTLPYLVHAKAHHVHAFEWNPDAVEALEKNLRLNGVEDQCTVYHGDNRNVSGDISVKMFLISKKRPKGDLFM